MKTLMVGVAGGSASGKTTITKSIKERFGDDVTVIKHDDYYKAHDDMTYEERSRINYDCPDAFDNGMLIEHLTALKSGQEVIAPIYDFTVHNRAPETQVIKPARVIVLDGILILSDKRICDLLDIKIFVDGDPDVRLARRIIRDVKKRARSVDSVIEQYLTTVKPMHEKYVEPSKRNADILTNGGKNEIALDMICNYIAKFLSDNC